MVDARRRGGFAALSVLCLLAMIAGAGPAAAYPRPGATERVTVASDGSEADNGSQQPSMSADGRYVAFQSHATNLVADDSNGASDVFVHDRETGVTERASVATDGTEANSGSWTPSISADGRYVAFDSSASNLVPDDTNARADVFVRDRQSGTTERVSVATDGSEGNSGSFLAIGPSISADGRHVVFTSHATNLVADDTNGASDVFVHDRETGVTERVSTGPAGEGSGASERPTISPDGRHVSFRSNASELAPDDGNGTWDIFVRDLQTATTERVSVRSDGAEANAESGAARLSADGRYVAFDSAASNLVPGDTNRATDVFVHDRDTGTTERVSVAGSGAEANGGSWSSSISADGRHVAFNSWATNLVPADTNGISDVFVHDRETGATDRVSLRTDGGQGNAAGNRNGSDNPSISADGRYVAFFSESSNLVPGDTNATWDIFVRDRGPVTGVGDLWSTPDGDGFTVSGWATFGGERVTSAADAADDGTSVGPLAARDLGAELTGASVTYRPEHEDLLVALRLASLPGTGAHACLSGPVLFTCAGEGTGGGLPGVLYGLELDVGNDSYEIRALRAGATADPAEAPHIALYRCAPDCAQQTRLAGGIGTTGDEVLAAVPLAAVGLAAGASLESIRAFSALGEAAPGPMLTLDELDLPDATIPAAEVWLGVARTGAPAGDVVFDTKAVLADGAFSGTVEGPSAEPGPHEVWARVCLGGACGVASRPLLPG